MSLHACCVYDFTLYGNELLVEDIKKALKVECKKWCFQYERCPTTAKGHYQGRLSLTMKKRISGVVAAFKGTVLEGAHFGITSTVNRDNTFYVMKKDSREAGPWKDDDLEIVIPKQFKDIILYPWQEAIYNDDGFDSRTINVIYDEKGGIGKSTLVGLLGCNHKGRLIPPMNDYKDVMRMVMDAPTSRLYLVDMPRSINQTKVEGLYSALEEIKNGHAWDDRYSFKEKWFDSPNIWVFCNRMPDASLLTRDRWKIYQIVDNQLVRYTDKGGWSAAPPPLAAGASISIQLNKF